MSLKTLLKRWLGVQSDIDNAVAEIARSKDAEIQKLQAELEREKEEARAALEKAQDEAKAAARQDDNRRELAEMLRIAEEFRNQREQLKRGVGRPRTDREPFNTSLDSDLKQNICILEKAGIIKRGAVGAVINARLREWITPMLSVLEEIVSPDTTKTSVVE